MPVDGHVYRRGVALASHHDRRHSVAAPLSLAVKKVRFQSTAGTEQEVTEETELKKARLEWFSEVISEG